MRPSLFLAMGSAIVLLLIIHPATGGGCGGAVQGQGLGCGRDRVPSQPAVPARWRRRKITGGEIEPAITSNPANLRNIIMTWQQEFGCGARTDSSDRRSTAARPGHTARSPPDGLPGNNGGLRVRPVDLGRR